MLGVEDVVFVSRECLAELSVDEKLVLEPERSGLEEREKAAWRYGEIRLEDALELEEWLVVKPDVTQVTPGDPRGAQAVLDGPLREARVALDASEPLLLGRGDYHAVPQQAGGAVVVIGREA